MANTMLIAAIVIFVYVNLVHLLALLTRCYSADHVGAVIPAGQRMKSAVTPGYPLAYYT